MAVLLRMPKLGLEMEQGTVVEWVLAEGDDVEKGAVVAEIESDKAVGEVEARESGVLRRVLVPVGDTVPTGAPLGVVADVDESIDDLLADAGVDATATVDEATTDADESTASADDGTTAGNGSRTTASGSRASVPTGSEGVLATPRAKGLARERGHDLASVTGSGPGGVIVGADVERAGGSSAVEGVEPSAVASVDRPPRSSAQDSVDPAGEAGPPVAETRSLVGVRGAVAAAMTTSAREAPQVTLHRDVTVDALFDTVDALVSHAMVDLSMIDVFLLALSAALADHPGLNGRFEDGEHRVAAVQNVGYAVATDHGLLTPVLEDLGSRSLVALADRRRDRVERVLDGSHTAADLQGGTFTVTNLGPYDVDEFTPILNPPEVAILGLGRVQDAPVRATDGGVAFERRLPVSLTIDHRALDGADGAAFLQSLAAYVEDPRRLLLVGD